MCDGDCRAKAGVVIPNEDGLDVFHVLVLLRDFLLNLRAKEKGQVIELTGDSVR